MSVLIIGGDKVTNIKNTLKSLGATKVYHWDSRKKASTCKKIIPHDTQCVIMLTTFLNHNSMKHFKSEAKKKRFTTCMFKIKCKLCISRVCKNYGYYRL